MSEKKKLGGEALRNTSASFKGWTKPGPMPDLEQMHEVSLDDGETLDALCGHFRIFQLKDGHRFSTDDVLTAWYATSWCPSARRALDLGSGLGTVAMCVAWRLQGVSVVGVEAQEMSVALAKKSRLYNGLQGRYEIRQGDFRTQGLSEDERFDLITGTPPYWPLDAGVQSEHEQKIACRFEVRGDVADYCHVAARHLAPGGTFTCVFQARPQMQLDRVFQGAEDAGLMVVRWRPIVMRGGDEPLLGLFMMMRKEDLPEKFIGESFEEPPLVIREKDGRVGREYQSVKMSFGFPP